jgi:zinc transport system substrate-binding protein
MADLQDHITGACLFPEAGQGADLLAPLVGTTGAAIGGTLDPEGAALEPGPGLYPALIIGLAETIAACPR